MRLLYYYNLNFHLLLNFVELTVKNSLDNLISRIRKIQAHCEANRAVNFVANDMIFVMFSSTLMPRHSDLWISCLSVLWEPLGHDWFGEHHL